MPLHSQITVQRREGPYQRCGPNGLTGGIVLWTEHSVVFTHRLVPPRIQAGTLVIADRSTHHHPQMQVCVHSIVTGGGLGPDGFVHRRRYLLPRRVLQIVFRAKLLEKLEALLRDRKADVGRHSGHELLRDARRLDWNIDIRRPLLGAEHVVRYFARYTRRIAISDRRLVRYDGHRVTFRWRDRADGNRQKLLSLEGSLFAQRFLQHVLPTRFVRIRRYGLLSNRVREALLARCRELLDADRPLMLAPPGETRAASCRRIFDVDLDRCPQCRDGRLVVRARWRATRSPIEPVIVATLTPRGS